LFLGSLSYLADDISGVRVPMGVLHAISGSTAIFQWDNIHKCAFNEIKSYIHQFQKHRRKPLDYSDGAPPINLIMDASNSGIAGVISQGDNWKTAPVGAFFSAKLSTTQQNYLVHEQEMLAALELMLQHRNILQGTEF
jgi:hypothetical protein